MRLSNETIETLRYLVKSYIESTDSDSEQMHSIADMTTHINSRFEIVITKQEIFPETIDFTLNLLIKEYLDNSDSADEVIEAVWEYLENKYGFAIEEHDLGQVTFDEALNFAINETQLKGVLA